ncbi:LacI family DNA-binding transcriptional regulator [Fulvimarina sp. MAC8]|uniref:LacI family DNA-binding transcriptional regulator n=1 Tax=Fulvimarina sp. MAC8 TaxID=3162874 RepID=UPI0032EEAEB1
MAIAKKPPSEQLSAAKVGTLPKVQAGLSDAGIAVASPTLKDVARAAGVSVAAVSKALNNREGVSDRSRTLVMKAAAELGYLDRNMKKGTAGLTCASLVTLGPMVSNDAFYQEIVDGITGEAAKIGLSVVIQILDETNGPHEDTISAKGADAVILMGVDRPAYLDMVEASGLPAVIVNGMDRRMRFPSVSPDYHFGGWAATKHLIDLGHKDIVHLTHVYRESLRRRLEGFHDAMTEAGLAYDPDRHFLDLGSPDMIGLSAKPVIEAYLRSRETLPSALFCMSDAVALAAIQAMRSMGLTAPDDISVVGFDGLSIGAHSSPSLTTMHVDRRRLGALAIGALVDHAEDREAPVERIGLGVTLLPRQSSGPVPDGRS